MVGVTKRRIWRGLRVLVLAALGFSVLIGGILVWQLGPAEAVSASRRKLDDLQIYGERASLWREAQRLKHANPESDARGALKLGDRRLLAMAAVGPFLPGLENRDFETCRHQFGVRFLAVGCVIASQEDSDFRVAAFDYAKRYNPIIVGAARQ